MIRRQELILTTDASGAGTVQTPLPIGGRVVEIRQNSAGWGGTADYTFTRPTNEGGGTVLALTDTAGPFSAYPGGSVFGMANVATPIPVEGYLTMRVAQATAATAGTVHVFHH